MNPLIIAGAEIRMDEEGRYCLNDLHRSAGGAKRHGPSYWLKNLQTRALLAELRTTGIPVVTREGIAGGTFVAKELVYAYAMWISPAFHLRVIRAYDAMVQTEIDRLNGVHFRVARAHLELQEGVEHASRCGSGLSRWRREKPVLKHRLLALEREMQPSLFEAS